MENWKAGEMHGTFEVIQSLDAADTERARMVMIFAGLVLACLLLGMGAWLANPSWSEAAAGKSRAMAPASPSTAASSIGPRTSRTKSGTPMSRPPQSTATRPG